MNLRTTIRKVLESLLPSVYDGIVAYKAIKYEKLYARVSDFYWNEAQRLGLQWDEKSIMEAVRNRRALKSKIAKKWGQIHTFFIDDGGDYTKVHMNHALQRGGCCTVVDWQEINGSVPIRNSKWPIDDPKLIKGLTKQIERVYKESTIDWIFCSVLPLTLGIETVKHLAELQIPLVSYWADDKQNYWKLMGGMPGDCPKTKYFDLCWTTSSSCLPWYVMDGGRAISMPEGAEPEIFYIKRKGEFRYNVSFVGKKYGKRPRFIKDLSSRGVHVKTFGRGWTTPISWQEMAQVFAYSRINLGIAGIRHSNRIFCLKGRDFEVPLAGGLYLTQYSEELARCYQINEEVICYGSTEECVDIIRYLLANTDYCEEIRRKGQKRALREHTWDMRFKKILGFMGILDDPYMQEGEADL